MIRWQTRVIAAACGVCFSFSAIAAESNPDAPQIRGTFRFAEKPLRADISPRLRDMPVIPPPDESTNSIFAGSLMIDPDPIGRKINFLADDHDPTVQDSILPLIAIPAPSSSFAVGTGTANPPDPVGDVGQTHYVRMSNASFQIFRTYLKIEK
jgi:hypothetical protein